VDQQLHHVAAPTFPDAQHSIFTARTVLAQREPQGGGKSTPFRERTAVCECTGKCTGGERANTAQFSQKSRRRVGFDRLRNPTIKMSQVIC
jgi:hypothetical protein